MNSAKIKNLRILLQAVSAQFKNLTEKDLIQLNWSVRKRIFTELIDNTAYFEEQSLDLNSLNESYNKQLSLLKLRQASSELILDYKQNYKTAFVNLIIDCLKVIRWPPSLAPFSDVFDLIYSDNNSFIDATLFVLRTVYSNDCDLSTSNFNSINTPVCSSKTTGSTSYTLESRAPTSNSNTIPRPTKTNRSSKISISPAVISAASPMTCNPSGTTHSTVQDDPYNNLAASSTSIHVRNNFETPYALSSVNDSYVMPKNAGKQQAKNSVFNIPSEAIEILQYQNELLVKKLRGIQTVLQTRMTFDTKVTNLLNDIEDEVTGDFDTSVNLNEQIDAEVNNHRTNLKRRMTMLMQRWKEIQVLCKQAVAMTTATPRQYLHELTCTDLTAVQSFDEPGAMRTVNRTRMSERSTHSGSVTTPLVKKFVPARAHISSRGFEIPKSGRLSHTKATIPFVSSGQPNQQKSTINASTKSLIRETLGIVTSDKSRRQIPVENDDQSTYVHDSTNDSLESVQAIAINSTAIPKIQINLSKVNFLQRDLFHFAEKIFQFFSVRNNSTSLSVNYLDSNAMSFPCDPYPTSSVSAQCMQIYEDLALQARGLYLHLSCFAPLTALLVDDSGSAPEINRQSNTVSQRTALELLIQECQEVVVIKKLPKGVQAHLQTLFDRAMVEQVICIRALNSSQSQIREYINNGMKFGNLMDEFFKRLSNAVQENLKPIHSKLNILNEIYSSIEKSDTINSNRLNLHPDLAELINLLRFHRGDIKDASQVLHHTLLQVQNILFEEIRRLHNAKKKS